MLIKVSFIKKIISDMIELIKLIYLHFIEDNMNKYFDHDFFCQIWQFLLLF